MKKAIVHNLYNFMPLFWPIKLWEGETGERCGLCSSYLSLLCWPFWMQIDSCFSLAMKEGWCVYTGWRLSTVIWRVQIVLWTSTGLSRFVILGCQGLWQSHLWMTLLPQELLNGWLPNWFVMNPSRRSVTYLASESSCGSFALWPDHGKVYHQRGYLPF